MESPRFSYLPPGTPAWPTAIPEQLPNVVDSSVATATPPQPIKETKKPRKMQTVLASLGVLILVPLLGAAITFATLYSSGQVSASLFGEKAAKNANTTGTKQQQAQQPLPAPASFKTTQQTNVNIAIDYPEDWTVGQPEQSTDGVQMSITSSQTVRIIVGIIHFSDARSASIGDADLLNQLHVQSLQSSQDVQNVKTIQTKNQQPAIGGTTWQAREVVLQLVSGEQMHFTTISVQRDKTFYSIYFFVPEEIYDEAMSKYLDRMLNSFKFLK